MIFVSHQTSAPCCMFGVRRYPPVSGISCGRGMIGAVTTDFHGSFK